MRYMTAIRVSENILHQSGDKMPKFEQVIDYTTANKPHFKMINVGRKRPTFRTAIASGQIRMSQEAFGHIKNNTIPKGDVLALAEAAGIMGAKRTPDFIPMCHTLPLDQVLIHTVLDDTDHAVHIYAQATAFAKTGVEMEALAGVNAALLTIWDLTKGVDPDLEISHVNLLVKSGGKSGLWISPKGIPDWLQEQLPSQQTMTGKTAEILVMSDRASNGVYQDETGPALEELLQQAGAQTGNIHVISDDISTIAEMISTICHEKEPDILIAAGGTGPGPRDVTPEALEGISNRMMHGLGDYLRKESLYFTDTAWLSRMTAAMIGKTLVVAFPGSPKAVKECWTIIEPFIGDALSKIAKQGFK